MTGYLACLDGSIGKDAVVAAMVNNEKEKNEREEGEEGEEEEEVGDVRVFVQRTMKVEDRQKER